MRERDAMGTNVLITSADGLVMPGILDSLRSLSVLADLTGEG